MLDMGVPHANKDPEPRDETVGPEPRGPAAEPPPYKVGRSYTAFIGDGGKTLFIS